MVGTAFVRSTAIPAADKGVRGAAVGSRQSRAQPSQAVIQVAHVSERPDRGRRVSGSDRPGRPRRPTASRQRSPTSRSRPPAPEKTVPGVVRSSGVRGCRHRLVQQPRESARLRGAVGRNRRGERRRRRQRVSRPVSRSSSPICRCATIPLTSNAGFAHGCNVGARAGSAPYVLLLNPDTTIEIGRSATTRQRARIEFQRRRRGAADRLSERRAPPLSAALPPAPLDLQPGVLPASCRSRARSGRMRRSAATRRTRRPGVHEWVSGACILLRRSLLEQLNGLDDGFFLYCEDTDLCLRIREAGSRRALRDRPRDRPRGRRVGLSFEPPPRGRCEPYSLRAQAPEPASRPCSSASGSGWVRSRTCSSVAAARRARAGHAESLRRSHRGFPRTPGRMARRPSSRTKLLVLTERASQACRLPTTVCSEMCGICGVIQIGGQPRAGRASRASSIA